MQYFPRETNLKLQFLPYSSPFFYLAFDNELKANKASFLLMKSYYVAKLKLGTDVNESIRSDCHVLTQCSKKLFYYGETFPDGRIKIYYTAFALCNPVGRIT